MTLTYTTLRKFFFCTSAHKANTASDVRPDISGYTEVRGIEYVTTRKSTGVFSVEKATKDAYSSHLDSVAGTVPGRLVFTASDSSSVYGRTSGVSVPAAYTLMIIKA